MRKIVAINDENICFYDSEKENFYIFNRDTKKRIDIISNKIYPQYDVMLVTKYGYRRPKGYVNKEKLTAPQLKH